MLFQYFMLGFLRCELCCVKVARLELSMCNCTEYACDYRLVRRDD
jgi:hypothetical protein